MNVKNNRRRQQSQEKIESVFLELLEEKEINQITVSDLCKLTGLNRSTFYANYQDIYDLADKIREKLLGEVVALYDNTSASLFNNEDYLRLFRHIQEHQILYKTYFKLGYDNQKEQEVYNLDLAEQFFHGEYIDYHVTFFKAGFNAMVKKWLASGCQETPETMANILVTEYRGRRPITDKIFR